ncbi:stage III sporulation protein AF [Salipaludibacillus aurantiacus]|uniref:Stage III sporulation protein AF n=1 Tax=Salipaludibacillus aurantiacus TaxID=1601833 RepID=A0A1H9PLV3_9BACI|nr:stage III sporulation protein AF [Salipaludibacillus aurantiacus]SER49158.1 stage III sporulation protein AF [Salipaludibacillus aurantiacus]
MGVVTSWISNIIMLVLFATILELMLPSSSTHRYVKLVVGLMILVVMLQPVLAIFNKDAENIVKQIDKWGQEVNLEKGDLDELEKTEIETVSLAYISEQVAVQLKGEAYSPILKEFNKEITDIEISFNSLHSQPDLDNLTGISVTVQSPDPAENEESESEEETGIFIEPIEIKSEGASSEKKEDTEGKKLMEMRLAEIWEVPAELILVQEKGGDNR